ncbi:BatD family protein [Pseudomonas oryzihabitans]|uniref:BatD family protein n=1 Tax=Pseudomonas oryzihabitans TaxID=47885 RepID=UPI0011A1EA35|nr:BatD family protein [Pseudomonas psychrotolerans]
MKAHPLLLPLALLVPLAQAADLSARLERSQVSENETLELIIETTDPAQFGKPDLQPLAQDFKVLGVRQNSLPPGERVTTRWNVTLQPKATGALTIPALTLDGARSEPLTVTVAATAARRQTREPVYLEASVDRPRLYVQAETLLTIRLYHAVALYDDHVLTPPAPKEARVDLLGTPQVYERDVDGVRHGVIEWRYAIHPLQSGTLVLPPQTFSATLAGGIADSSRAGQPIQLHTPALTLDVQPQPASYPPQTPWLPARSLSLTQQWNPAPEDAREGSALTRTLQLRAEGLAPGQLPPLVLPDVEGVKRYAEQPRLSMQTQARGLVGQREERIALIPATTGDKRLPPVEVVWWNTETDTLERATLPAQTLVVAEDPTLQPVVAPATKSTSSDRGLWRWQLATAILALTTLLGFGLWWRARRQPAVLPSVPDVDSRLQREELRRACQSNDPHATRHALDAWARQQPETLAAMGARFEPLAAALDDLNGALYSEAGQRWQGETLWQAINALPPLTPAAVHDTLPPLYPR